MVHTCTMAKKGSVSILGCGWYGIHLGAELQSAGYAVRGSTTSEHKLQLLREKGIEAFQIEIRGDEIVGDKLFFDCDILIISIPPSLGSTGPAEYRARFNVLLSELKCRQFQSVIFISSIGVYGNPNKEVTELEPPQPDTGSGTVLLDAELRLKTELSTAVTILRFAGLIGPGRHPGRFLAGKKGVENGLAPVNLVHLHDCTGLTRKIIDLKAFGRTYNICTPQHPSREDYYTRAAAIGRYEIPQFKKELTKWKTVSSVYIPSEITWNYLDLTQPSLF